jgi:hypothetical protein
MRVPVLREDGRRKGPWGDDALTRDALKGEAQR